MKEYIPTSVFRRFLMLLAASGLKLPETVNLNIDGVAREFPVLHKMELSDYPRREGLIEPTVMITSWAVVPNEGMEIDPKRAEVIHPEHDWNMYGHFWVGKIEKVYKDLDPTRDKKLSGFGWCGNTERELAYPSFGLLNAGPLFTFQANTSALELFSLPTLVTPSTPGKPTISVGTIDADGDGTVIPVAKSGLNVEHLVPAVMNERGGESEQSSTIANFSRFGLEVERESRPSWLERVGLGRPQPTVQAG